MGEAWLKARNKNPSLSFGERGKSEMKWVCFDICLGGLKCLGKVSLCGRGVPKVPHPGELHRKVASVWWVMLVWLNEPYHFHSGFRPVKGLWLYHHFKVLVCSMVENELNPQWKKLACDVFICILYISGVSFFL